MDLARVNHPMPVSGANREDAIVIAVLKNGRVYFRSDRITPDQLPSKLADHIEHGMQDVVYLKVDARTRYGDLGAVLDALHSAGVGKVWFLVDQRSRSTLVQ